MAKKAAVRRPKDASNIATFKILADQNRHQCIMVLLRSKRGESVSAIAKTLGMSHSSVSHMLAVLHDADMVTYTKKGREVLYTIAKTPQTKRVALLMMV
ncbi:helix-turn-helix transcriptional regulator [Candidatus Kaiserbacteria bacterium]|nr:helix-turn-helix transcriptional regulator [Candidatus Kaiserbacteria bacterium]